MQRAPVCRTLRAALPDTPDCRPAVPQTQHRASHKQLWHHRHQTAACAAKPGRAATTSSTLSTVLGSPTPSCLRASQRGFSTAPDPATSSCSHGQRDLGTSTRSHFLCQLLSSLVPYTCLTRRAHTWAPSAPRLFEGTSDFLTFTSRPRRKEDK